MLFILEGFMLVFLRMGKPVVPPVTHHGITEIRSSLFGGHKTKPLPGTGLT